MKEHFFLLNDESEKNMGGSWYTFLPSCHSPSPHPQRKRGKWTIVVLIVLGRVGAVDMLTEVLFLTCR